MSDEGGAPRLQPATVLRGRAGAVWTGGCLCGGVRYRVIGPLRPVVGCCHCRQCRRTSGHFVATTQAWRDRLGLDADERLRWYESSPGVHRGFCSGCGASVFWLPGDSDRLSIMAGTLDDTPGLRLVQHIHTTAAGGYYILDPGVAQAPGAAPLPAIPDDTERPDGEEER